MKKYVLMAVAAALLLAVGIGIFLVSNARLKDLDGPVTIHFEHQDTGEKTSVTLTDEESARILEILEGEIATPDWGAIPSCGFSRDTAIEIEGRRYALALDTCPQLQDCLTLRYIGITEEEQQVIEEIFLRYGAKYPNV